MIQLTSEQKQLLFDYCIGLKSQEQIAEAEELISSNKEAAQIHSKLKVILAPLNTLEPESCPDALAERTVWRLKSLANSSQDRLQQFRPADLGDLGVIIIPVTGGDNPASAQLVGCFCLEWVTCEHGDFAL